MEKMMICPKKCPDCTIAMDKPNVKRFSCEIGDSVCPACVPVEPTHCEDSGTIISSNFTFDKVPMFTDYSEPLTLADVRQNNYWLIGGGNPFKELIRIEKYTYKEGDFAQPDIPEPKGFLALEIAVTEAYEQCRQEAIEIEVAHKEQIKKIFDAYDDYIKLLGLELGDVVSLASSHGWKSVRYEKGVELRAKIEQLKKEYM